MSMALIASEEDPTSLSYDQYWENHYTQAWNISRSRVLSRSRVMREAALDLLHELGDSVIFLKKVFADRQRDLPTMEASLQSMLASAFPGFESWPPQLKLVDNRAEPRDLVPGDYSNAPELPRDPKRHRDNDDQSASPEKRQRVMSSEHPAAATQDVADRARGQWQTQGPQHPMPCPTTIYIMPDIVPTISKAEVNALHWVFRYPAHGNGYYIIRCHWGPCTKTKCFTRHPFESGQALRHFNDPYNNHGKDRFSEAEIMKAFALQVQDANDEWAIANNLTLSRPNPSSSDNNQALTAKKSKNKGLAGRSSTKVVTRKPTASQTDNQPHVAAGLDENYTPSVTSSVRLVDQMSDGRESQGLGQEEGSLSEIMVRTDSVS